MGLHVVQMDSKHSLNPIGLGDFHSLFSQAAGLTSDLRYEWRLESWWDQDSTSITWKAMHEGIAIESILYCCFREIVGS